MTTIIPVASHQPGLHGRGFRQLKPLVRQRPPVSLRSDLGQGAAPLTIDQLNGTGPLNFLSREGTVSSF